MFRVKAAPNCHIGSLEGIEISSRWKSLKALPNLFWVKQRLGEIIIEKRGEDSKSSAKKETKQGKNTRKKR